MKKTVLFTVFFLVTALFAANVHIGKNSDAAIKFAAKDLARCLSSITGQVYNVAESAQNHVAGDIVIVDDSNLEKQQWCFVSRDGKLYISPIFDCYNGEILAVEMQNHMKKELCIDTLRQLKQRCGNLHGVILHSDRGCQYTSEAFRSTIAKYGMIQSLSSTGKCFDNARMESFFATLKKEKLYRIPTYAMTREQVKSVVFRYIFAYYNTCRITSFNPGGLPPVKYRTQSQNSVA